MSKLEIERKFLVHEAKLPDFNSGNPEFIGAYLISQGYLTPSDAPNEVRVRTKTTYIAESASNAYSDPTAYLTIKGPGLIGLGVRREFETQINFLDALDLLDSGIPQLRKVRFKIRATEHLIWEIDMFEAPTAIRGLVLAEIELPDLSTPFPKPDWLGREVTDDPEYKNRALADRKL